MSIIAWNYNKICIPEKNKVNLKKTFNNYCYELVLKYEKNVKVIYEWLVV